MKRFSIILLIAIAAAASALGYYWWNNRASAAASSYRTAVVSRGDVLELIPASGTLEPIDSVDIGAQVAGRIIEFGKDLKDPTKPVDFRSEVEENSLLVRIDDSLYKADKQQADAQLASAQANLQVAHANLDQYHVKLTQAENDWNRAQTLGAGEALAKTTYDNYKAVFETAKAQVEVGTAAIKQAEASIQQAQADQFRAQRNLDYCTILSPVKGTIIDRRVNLGQTVVSSLNAPSLFLIGKDMTKMQIWVSINEADSSRVHEGMPVTFTVDGMDRVFQGITGKVRWNATMTQQVVTYTVEVNIENPDGVLIPYRTANVKFMADQALDTLKVPNSALRWRPRNADSGNAEGGGSGGSSGSGGAGSGRNGRGRRNAAAAAVGRSKDGTVYILDGDEPKAVSVQLGITDETFTAITGGDLKEGDTIITGINVADDNGNGTTNPFAPQIFRGGGGGGGGGGRRGN